MPTKKPKPSRTLVKRRRDASWHIDHVFWRLKSRHGYVLSAYFGEWTRLQRRANTWGSRTEALQSRAHLLGYTRGIKLVRVTVWRRKAPRS